MALEHFDLFDPFIRCLYYFFDFPVSRNMAALVLPVWMMNFPVELFVSPQSYRVWRTVVLLGAWVRICLCGAIVVTWLSMRFLTLRILALVLYLCTSGTLMMIP